MITVEDFNSLARLDRVEVKSGKIYRVTSVEAPTAHWPGPYNHVLARQVRLFKEYGPVRKLTPRGVIAITHRAVKW